MLPTEKLIAESSEFLKKAEKMEKEICSVLDQDEKAMLKKLEEKLLTQFDGMEQNEKNRQEVYYSEKSITATGKI